MNTIKTLIPYALYILLSTVLITVLLFYCGHSLVDDIYVLTERAYFEGQKDALNGDVRIKKKQDSCWIWTKSPWNRNREPKFNPSFECE